MVFVGEEPYLVQDVPLSETVASAFLPLPWILYDIC